MNETVRARKPFRKRSLRVATKSNKFQAGTRRNKKYRFVPTFASDRAK